MQTNSCSQHQPAPRGAIIILVVLCVPVVLALSAFALNIAWMQLARTELRTATDASARAGGRSLSLTQDVASSRQAAIDAASRNTVGGVNLTVAPADVVFGESKLQGNGKYRFKPKSDGEVARINGIRVTGRRTAGSPSGAVPMLFSGVLDTNSFEPVKTAVATQIDRDVVLVLDVSGSMSTTTPTGDRLSDLKSSVHAFLTTLEGTPQNEKVGIVTYSTDASRDQEMTFNYGHVQSTVDATTADGSTAIGLGILEGINAIVDASYARSNAAKTFVVMTDGIHNTGIDPEGVALTAHQNHGITVHTITFSTEAEQETMQTVASNGGGSHWHADDEAALVDVFIEVANNLPTLITE